MRLSFGLSLIVTTCLLAACDLGGDNACTEIAVASVTLEILAADDGEPIDDAEVTFTLDDGAAQDAAERHSDGAFVLAYEETGTFAVTASAPGFEAVMRSYDVVLEEGGCHPVGVADVIELARAE